MSNIIQYHNDLNTLQMIGFTEKEIDIFFSICFKLKNQGTNEIVLTFEELKKLINYTHRGLERFCKTLDNTYKNLLSLNFRIEDDEKIVRFVLFTGYEINKKKKNLTIKVNEQFKYLLNDFMANYTKFDLAELVSLKSTYAKGMYKLLKQYRNTGWYDISMDEFRNLLGIPEYYKMGNIDQKIMKPILEELPLYFKNLKLEKFKRGRTIDRLKFTWDTELVKLEEVEVLPKEKIFDEVLQNKINIIKASIPILSDTDAEALLDAADVVLILEKYYKLALGKDIKNLPGFLISAVKNDWKTVAQAEKGFKKETGAMDQLEAKFQKRLYERIAEKEKS